MYIDLLKNHVYRSPPNIKKKWFLGKRKKHILHLSIKTYNIDNRFLNVMTADYIYIQIMLFFSVEIIHIVCEIFE